MIVHSCWCIYFIGMSAQGLNSKVHLNSNRFEFQKEKKRKRKGIWRRQSASPARPAPLSLLGRFLSPRPTSLFSPSHPASFPLRPDPPSLGLPVSRPSSPTSAALRSTSAVPLPIGRPRSTSLADALGPPVTSFLFLPAPPLLAGPIRPGHSPEPIPLFPRIAPDPRLHTGPVPRLGPSRSHPEPRFGRAATNPRDARHPLHGRPARQGCPVPSFYPQAPLGPTLSRSSLPSTPRASAQCAIARIGRRHRR
jgi:hypothetical protein